MDNINSSDSESENQNSSWVFYRNRPEWSDVTPIPQDDGPNPVVQIAYSEKFRDVYDYFRAVLETNEISERALALTADAIHENSANYTVWSYRRTLLTMLQKDLKQELEFISKIISHNPKNYQVWYHRQKIIVQCRDPTYEIDFTARMLKYDAKNYHAWQHRQWVLQEFNLWSEELNFVDRLIAEDPKNNSAWNQRYFVVANTSGFTEEAILKEYNYVTSYLTKDNESPYNYLRGILSQSNTPLHEFPNLQTLFESLHSSSNNKSRFTGAFLLGIYTSKAQSLELVGAGEEKGQLVALATNLCDDLASVVDTIREKYWIFQKDILLNRFSIRA